MPKTTANNTHNSDPQTRICQNQKQKNITNTKDHYQNAGQHTIKTNYKTK